MMKNYSVPQMAGILSSLLYKEITEKQVKEALVTLGYMRKEGKKYKLTTEGESHCQRGKFPKGTRYIYFNDWYEYVISEVREIIENED